MEISQRKLTRYRGNWDSYIEQKAAREEQQWAAYKNQQREIATLQEFADRFRAKASKAQPGAEQAQADRPHGENRGAAGQEKSVSFRFPQPPRSGLRVMTLKEVRHAYGDLVVYEALNFEAERGQRTVLVGPNGAGKSTLLKLLGGVLAVEAGERTIGHNVKVGYFAQYRADMLNPRQTVIESVLDCENRSPSRRRGRCWGRSCSATTMCSSRSAVLSGGEKTRLALVRLLLDPPNVLLMDEPTTHLDIGSIDALIGALRQYEGTLIFISHDVHFIRAIATTVLHISAGRLTFYPGDYQYYLDKSRAGSERAALVAGEKLRNAQPLQPEAEAKGVGLGMKEMREQRRQEADKRKAEAKAKRDQQKQAEALEMRVLALEGRQKEIAAELENPAAYEAGGAAVRLNRELMSVTEELSQVMAEWEAMAGKV